MKSRIFILLLLLNILPLGKAWLDSDAGLCSAQTRRPVDSQHPLWLVHVDVWNQADPQKIIDLIPDDIKPYVCMNLSLSCSYDKEKDVYMRPQNAIRTYKSWASVCQANNMWFTCQPASGGHTHIQDNDLETFEYFFKHYPNFLGWNYAEQFWGFDEAGDKSSSSQASRIALFAKLVPMHHKYGGFLTVSFCGNIWSHPLNPVGMMKRNSDLLQACKDYPEAILWLYKYTTSSCFYNNESVTFGPFVAGLAKNYGVRYDNCGYNGALDAILGENHGKKYPVAAGIGTVMEQTCQNGGAVWDGPELIWTEDFQNLSNTTVSGYTQRNWGTYPGFRNIWIDMFRKIIDGTMYIPTREEIVGKTKFLIVNDVTSGSDEDKYATWADLYDNLYKQTDAFNPNGGQWMNNYCYFKSTGRYGTIPMAPCVADELASSIPNKIKKSQRTTKWSSLAIKKAQFNNAYPVVSTGNLFVSRFKNQLITYTPYTYLNSKTTATANVPLQYNTCESIDLNYGKFSCGVIHEYADSITLYLNNYRTDTTTNVTDKIVINGATSEPTFSMTKRAEANATSNGEWNAENGTYTLSVSHNGPVDVTIKCSGAATERSTDYVPNKHLDEPRQASEVLPAEDNDALIIEAEDMNYRSVKSVETTPYYSSYSWVRGHSGNGFVDMGTNTSGALTKTFSVKKAGKYTVTVRFSNTSKSATTRIRVNSSAISKLIPVTATNEWKKASVTFTLNEGSNTFYFFNNGGAAMLVDQVIFTPAEEEAEKFDVNIHQSEDGTVTSDANSAAEGDVVTLNVEPKSGFTLSGWNIIHGNVTIQTNEDGTYSFTMPDDIVTLEPVFQDNTKVYELNFSSVLSGTLPEGWRALESSTSIHEYPNSYSSGPRTFASFTGTYNKALYWRCQNADFGMQSDYPLTLTSGKYILTYAMAAWKGTPQCKAQILKSDNTILAQDSYFTPTPNANGNSSADLSKATERTLEFTVQEDGNYVINFQSDGLGYPEYLLVECRINSVADATAIKEINDGQSATGNVYNLQGQRISAKKHGNIYVKQGKKVRY